MKRALIFLRHGLFTAFVVGGLGFGTLQALAGVGTSECGPPYHGTCSSQQECQDICEGIYGPGIIGDCNSLGCCACFF